MSVLDHTVAELTNAAIEKMVRLHAEHAAGVQKCYAAAVAAIAEPHSASAAAVAGAAHGGSSNSSSSSTPAAAASASAHSAAAEESAPQAFNMGSFLGAVDATTSSAGAGSGLEEHAYSGSEAASAADASTAGDAAENQHAAPPLPPARNAAEESANPFD